MTLSAPARLLSIAWERALDLVFPPRCVTCNTFGAYICQDCARDVTPADPPRCGVCWRPNETSTCARCYHQRPAFKAVRSAFSYGGSVRDAVHALKFDGVSTLAQPMGLYMAETLERWSPPVEAIVPVPLSGARRRSRGYNQALLLAREVSRMAGIPVAAGALSRKRPTAPQTGQRDEESRWENVRDAFAAGRNVPAGGILLVDDVTTTGATLDACARVLQDAGAGPVYGLTFARED